MAIEPGENDIRFLMSLFDATQGDGNIQVSMQDVGNAIGLDKNEATQVAEWVMGVGWAELKTLSGGIGISAAGVKKAVSLGAKLPQTGEEVVRLGEGPVMNEDVRESVEMIIAALKLDVVQETFEFDTIAEMISDIRTLEIQLTSPKPKTAVARAVLESIRGVLKKNNKNDIMDGISQLLD